MLKSPITCSLPSIRQRITLEAWVWSMSTWISLTTRSWCSWSGVRDTCKSLTSAGMACDAIICTNSSKFCPKTARSRTLTFLTTTSTTRCKRSLRSRLLFRRLRTMQKRRDLKWNLNMRRLRRRKLRLSTMPWTTPCSTLWSYASSLRWTATWCI